MSRQSSSASLSAAVGHAASPFHASYVFAAAAQSPSPSQSHTHSALARGFTAHDVDAAEALSTLAHPFPPPPTPTRARAHTVGHDAAYNAHAYGAFTATHAAPTHTHPMQHSSSGGAMRYSAPPALLGTGTHASTTHHAHAAYFAHTDAAATADTPYLALNASRSPVSADERHAMRRALVQATTQAQQSSFGLGHKESGGSGNGGNSGSGSGSNGGTRRLVESPSGKPCPNCHTTTSTLWRSCALLSGQHYLCNACGLRFKKGKYCPLCTRVYYDADTHAGAFKQCVRCGTWTHKQCLARIGALAPDDLREQSPFERSPPYTCTRCNGGSTPSTSSSASNMASPRTDEGDSDAAVDRMQF